MLAFWDVFAKDGLRQPMLGYEFCIDTGTHTPVCCKKPSYGPTESKIIMDNIKILQTWNFVYHCIEGGWGSPIALAPKPHQEYVINIDDFIWRMCISYRALNRITNPFEYPIGRCDSAIEDIGDGSGFLWFISLDAVQGYNQISVRKRDQQKLAFFAPDNKKYTFSVMPFGPTNASTFYTFVTRVIQDEATKLFRMICNDVDIDLKQSSSKQPDFIVPNFKRTDDYNESCNSLRLPNLELDETYTPDSSESPLFDSKPRVIEADGGNLTVRQKMKNSENVHITGSRVIIDDLLLRSTSLSLLLLLLECYLRIYFKFRTTLKLAKCDFLQNKFEFVGHDILAEGNTTAESKYDMIRDWTLPTTADSLHSFVALCNFYQKFLPLFEMKVAPLRTLYTKYLYKNIPIDAWTEDSCSLR